MSLKRKTSPSRRAKIVATLGPASNSKEAIKTLIEAGLDIARVNMSHGFQEDHAKTIKIIREASKELEREIGILVDLQGPKIRVSKLKENLTLEDDSTWELGHESLGLKDHFIPTTYKDLVKDARVGARILFDDGIIQSEVIEKNTDTIKIKVKVGGILKSNKGINLPDCDVSAPSLTEKDYKDLLFAMRQDIDFIALSFVRTADDIKKVKNLLHGLKVRVPIVSKIEKPEAIENIEEIIKVSDVIMIARGDMGVELGNHLVPSIQKDLIKRCNLAGVPVITATQMLESMIENSTPTRAEASDVANAIWDGSDAVMLSGETAAGRYPLMALQTMDQIVKEAEKTPRTRPRLRDTLISSVSSANQVAASMIAEKTGARWILSLTQRGNSCLKMSRYRPKTGVLGVTTSLRTLRRMNLYWGITPFYVDMTNRNMDGLDSRALDKLKKEDKLINGDKIVITYGDGNTFKEGTSNSIRVEVIKDLRKASASEHRFERVEFEKGSISLDLDVCAYCQSCVTVCAYDVWEVDENNETRINVSNAQNCILDNQCIDVCPTGAIEIIPKN